MDALNARITRINPEQLHATAGYHHITIVEASRTAYLAGQCPHDRNGTLTGYGNLDAQIDQVVANALTALSAISAAPEHVVRSIIYVANPDSAALGAAWRRLTSSALAPAFTTASTLLAIAQSTLAASFFDNLAVPRVTPLRDSNAFVVSEPD